jgi:hypothetical protein
VLDGDLLGNDAPGFANRDDNAYHVVSAIDCDANTLLDGLTIEGGAATGDGQGPKARATIKVPPSTSLVAILCSWVW